MKNNNRERWCKRKRMNDKKIVQTYRAEQSSQRSINNTYENYVSTKKYVSKSVMNN